MLVVLPQHEFMFRPRKNRKEIDVRFATRLNFGAERVRRLDPKWRNQKVAGLQQQTKPPGRVAKDRLRQGLNRQLGASRERDRKSVG